MHLLQFAHFAPLLTWFRKQHSLTVAYTVFQFWSLQNQE